MAVVDWHQRVRSLMSHIMRQDCRAAGTPSIAALGRSLKLLEAVLADRDGRSAPEIATELGVPRATAHRQVITFVHEGYLRRLANGALVAGPRLIALAGHVERTHVLVAAARPVLRQLAARFGCVAQLGTLDGDMVTYRFKAGEQAGQFFTRVSQQLEAYCTGLGKVMLAHLPEREREAYLATGPFPALTARTITDPAVLRLALDQVRQQGLAIDEQEIAEDLTCFAVPLRLSGEVVAAISVSLEGTGCGERWRARIIANLRAAADEIDAVLAAWLAGA